MAPNEVSANFCAECGAPLTSYASTGPFEHLFAEGAAYRQAATRPRKLIVVVGVWLIFGAAILTGVEMLSGFGMFNETLVARLFQAPVGVALIGVSAVMIWKTTRSYLAWRRGDDHAGHPLSPRA